MFRKLACIFLILAILFLGGCGPNNTEQRENTGTKQIKLVITKNFGREEILSREIAYEPNMTVMDLLFAANLDIQAGYSGSFVDGIDGLLSKRAGLTGERQDWFYFVNGIFADVGALDYFPQAGDVVWWDYRPWKASGASPTAVIGAFPKTFQYGYLGKINPTLIMAYEEDWELAKSLQKKMKELGVAQAEISDVLEKEVASPKGPTILLGQWDLIKDIDYIKQLNANYNRAGFYGFFGDNKLNLLDYNLKPVKSISENAGLIISTGQGSGDPNPLWIVTGIDKEGLNQAVETLVNHPEKLSGLYNVAVVNGEIIGLPLEKN